MATIVTDLGVATAYGYAKSKGYTGTEEEFAELMASYANVAEAAAQSASDAADSATNAHNSEVAAEGYAGTAQTKAGEASNSAQSASGSAGTATNKAAAASADALKSEGYAVGKQNGAAVASGSPYYHNNAEYFAGQAGDSASAAQAVLESIPEDYSALSTDVDKLKADLAGVESGMTASTAYSRGDLIVANGDLYRALTAISSGATLTPNTNVVKTTVEAELKRKADTNGNYPDMTVGNAEQLVATVGVNDKVPYNFRASGGGADIGDREVDMVVGGTVAWNQLLKNGDFANGTANWDGRSATLTVTNGVARTTMTGEAWNNDLRQSTVPLSVNHVYLVSSENRASVSMPLNFRNPGGSIALRTFNATTAWAKYESLIKATTVMPNGIGLNFYGDGSSYSGEWYETKNFNCLDLTQMFGSDIADYIYSLETATAGAGVAWFRKLFPNDYYAYDAGTLKSVKTTAHKMVGFNAWDEEWELGGFEVNGSLSARQDCIRSKNYIPIVGGQTYHIKQGNISDAEWTYWVFYDADKSIIDGRVTVRGTVVAPQNALYARFQCQANYGTTYKNDICINLSYDGSRNGEYAPYEAHTYALDDVELRGIPKLDADNRLYYDGDTYADDGTVTRRYVEVTYDGSEDESWLLRTDGNSYFSLKVGAKDTIVNGSIMSNSYPQVYISASNTVTGVDTVNSSGYNGAFVLFRPDGYADMSVNDLRTLLSQKPLTVIYELYTPTTETADPYHNPQIVDDFGTEEYVDTRDPAIPVGHDTQYRANLRAKLESAPNSPDSNGDYIMRKTASGNAYVPLTLPVDELPAAPTTDGNYQLKCTVADGAATYTWESIS